MEKDAPPHNFFSLVKSIPDLNMEGVIVCQPILNNNCISCFDDLYNRHIPLLGIKMNDKVI